MAGRRSIPELGALLGRTALVALAVAVLGIAITVALRVTGSSDVAIFVVAAITLAALAALVREATDLLGSRFPAGADHRHRPRPRPARSIGR